MGQAYAEAHTGSFAWSRSATRAYRQTPAGSVGVMSVPGVDQVGERPLEELVQNASQQAVVLAREQLDVARQELLARAKQAFPGAAMFGGGALLAALASGTGTAALILLLARRPRASAAALGVTGAYAGAGAVLARGGIVRLRQVGPQEADMPVEDEPTENDEQNPPAAKRQTKPAARSPRRTKSATKLAAQQSDRVKPASKTPSPRRAASASRAARTRRRTA